MEARGYATGMSMGWGGSSEIAMAPSGLAVAGFLFLGGALVSPNTIGPYTGIQTQAFNNQLEQL